MITILKLAGLSAVLSAGLVTGLPGAEQAPAAQASKVFYDRVQDGAAPNTVLASIDPRALAVIDVNRSDKGHRIRNEDVVDLYRRVSVGTKVVVLR